MNKESWGIAGIGVVTFIGVSALIYPIYARPKMAQHGHSCLSNLKQLMTSIAIYTEDNNDRMPLAYTFDAPSNVSTLSEADRKNSSPQAKFIKAVFPYAKNEKVFLCPKDDGPTSSDQEGLKGIMSYIHCQSLKGLIENYSSGGRSLLITNDTDPNQPYLRDPIRSTNEEGIVSPHGVGVCVGFVDSHAKYVKDKNLSNIL